LDSDSTFLTAEWRDLAMLNYEVEPSLLRPFVPVGTELDSWNGRTFVSLVGFRFLNTVVRGIPIPFHRNFDEVNLRFYVRRFEGDELRRGVVFIREVVPRWAIAAVARTVYGENYVALPMRHSIERSGFEIDVKYGWRTASGWAQISLQSKGRAEVAAENSEEQFITEHYWGYARQRDGSTAEYRVAHPAWRVWQGKDATFEGDVNKLYGEALAGVLSGKPRSAFLAEGSEVTVFRGRRL